MAGSHHARAADAAWRRPGLAVVFAVLLVLATAVGRLTIPDGSQLALVWPAAGFGILWLSATRTRRGLLGSLVLLPALVVAVNLLEGVPLRLACVFGASSTAQALVGWCLVAWRPRPVARHGVDGGGQRWSWQLATTGDLWWLLFVAALSSLASAVTVSVGHTLSGFGVASPLQLVELGVRNATSVIVLVAPVLRVLGRTRHVPAPLSQARMLERLLMAAAFATIYTAVFWVNPGLPLAFVVLPLSAWMALRRPTTTVTMGVVIIAASMTATTMAGRGVFGHLRADTGILLSQVFVAMIGVLSTLLALHRDERDALLRRIAETARSTERQSALLEAVFAAVPHGLSVVDCEGRPLLRNPAVRRFLGAPTEAVRGAGPGYDLYYPDGRPIPAEDLPIARALRGMEVEGMDVLFKTPACHQGRMFSTTAHRLPDGGDEPWSGGVVVALHDVTEARRAAEEVSAAHDLLAGVLDGATEQSIIGTDAHGRITVFNRGAEKMLGWTREEAIGRTPEFLHEPNEVVERAREMGMEPGFGMFVECARRQGHDTRRWTHVRRDGSHVQVMLTITALRSVNGRITGFIGVGQDITDRLLAEQRLADSEQMLRLSFETAPTAIAAVSLPETIGAATGRVLRTNRALAEFTGLGQDALLGGCFDDLVHPADRERYAAAAGRLRPDVDEHVRCELRFRHTDGGTRWGALSAAVVRPTAAGQEPFLMCLVEDVTARRQAVQDLAYQATHDALTGLVNRRDLSRRLQDALAGSSPSARVGVLYLDLDGFKAVNDTAGHETGDEVLRQVAARLSTCTRGQDVVGRLGGDEFAVVCPGLHEPSELQHVAERILLAVDHPISVDGSLYSVGASIGSVVSQAPASAEELLHRADQAMYAAKRAGKNRVVSDAQDALVWSGVGRAADAGN